MKDAVLINLNDLKTGEKAVVKEFSGGPDLKQKLESLGLRINKEITVMSKQSMGGPVVVRIDEMDIAVGYGMAKKIMVDVKRFNVLLMGNPNVGKSVVFSRLTDVDVISSNYAGTTVDYTIGNAVIGEQRIKLTDVPGAYTLEPTSKAEEVAKEMLFSDEPDLVINTIDATNLERNLFLTLQILEREKPTIVLLNKWDIAKLKGITIDIDGLSKMLGVPVVPFVAITGEGIKELSALVKSCIDNSPKPGKVVPKANDEKWKLIGEISGKIQKIVHKHPTVLEKLAEASIRPVTGFPIAIGTLILIFYLIRTVGEGLINYILDPLFNKIYYPLIVSVVRSIFSPGLMPDILLGKTADFMASFGVLTTGLYIPFVIVLPYIFIFYFLLGFLEDFGYIPRLAVLLDSFLHKLGIHGYATIPLVLGLGCKIPSLLSTRILETRREKIIANLLILMIAPCMPQSAMVISVLGKYGTLYILAVFGTLIVISIISGIFLNKILKGETPELFVEIPAYQMPRADILLKKGWLRIRHFLVEAVPLIIGGVFIMCIFERLGLVNFIANLFGPLVSYLLGLPKEISSIMILGFLRKEISIALLIPFNLSAKQLVIACIFLSIYLPCLATTFILLKELKLKDTLLIIGINFTVALGIGTLLNFVI